MSIRVYVEEERQRPTTITIKRLYGSVTGEKPWVSIIVEDAQEVHWQRCGEEDEIVLVVEEQ